MKRIICSLVVFSLFLTAYSADAGLLSRLCGRKCCVDPCPPEPCCCPLPDPCLPEVCCVEPVVIVSIPEPCCLPPVVVQPCPVVVAKVPKPCPPPAPVVLPPVPPAPVCCDPVPAVEVRYVPVYVEPVEVCYKPKRRCCGLLARLFGRR